MNHFVNLSSYAEDPSGSYNDDLSDPRNLVDISLVYVPFLQLIGENDNECVYTVVDIANNGTITKGTIMIDAIVNLTGLGCTTVTIAPFSSVTGNGKVTNVDIYGSIYIIGYTG